MSRLQKIILIIGFIIVVFAIGFLLYWLFFKPFIPSPNGNMNNANISGLPSANGNANIRVAPNANLTLPPAGNINAYPNANIAPTPVGVSGVTVEKPTEATSLTDSPAYDPSLARDGNAIYYYDKTDGKFYSIGPDGKPQVLGDKVFHQVETITWSPKKDKAVLEYPDGSNIVYDFTTKSQITLPAHWRDFGFSPEGDKIISKNIGMSSENNFLIISDASGTKTRIVQGLGDNAGEVLTQWSPNNQMIAMDVKGLDLDRQEIFFIGLNNENFKSMVVEGRGFQGQWAPQGDRLLYSVYNTASDNKPELWMADATANTMGRNRKPLNLQTWADKCTFYDNATVYCAIPSQLEEGAGMIPDEMDNSSDTVYKINLNTGSKTLVATPTQSHTMKNIMVSSDAKYLYFTDKNDGKLYKIEIK